MSSEDLVAAFGRAMQEYQRAVDLLDQRVAERLGLNRTDMRCLELLLEPEGAAMSPGELAVAAGLTTGGVTTAIDRLERAGYVTRERDAGDRRRVTVRPTPLAQQSAWELYGPIVTAGGEFLRRYSDEVLQSMIEVLEFSTGQYDEHAKRIKD
ncbi:MarR family winged helix-turn-helix transcriptional regulator [Dactylosporangium sp. NPDC051541]|uniref:MarR family winged helix-turn-helix transcriptional regulator n=1 Tax=Dactylosporangium sp. NPDC051541 TaxID=3363977 RepID=UPI00378FB770